MRAAVARPAVLQENRARAVVVSWVGKEKEVGGRKAGAASLPAGGITIGWDWSSEEKGKGVRFRWRQDDTGIRREESGRSCYTHGGNFIIKSLLV